MKRRSGFRSSYDEMDNSILTQMRADDMRMLSEMYRHQATVLRHIADHEAFIEGHHRRQRYVHPDNERRGF